VGGKAACILRFRSAIMQFGATGPVCRRARREALAALLLFQVVERSIRDARIHDSARDLQPTAMLIAHP